MANSKKYVRKFIILEPYTKYLGQKPKGYTKIEVRDGKGKIETTIEGLLDRRDPEDVVKVFFVSKEQDKIHKAYIGSLDIKENGKGHGIWTVNPESLGQTGLSIDTFKSILIGLTEAGKQGPLKKVYLTGAIEKQEETIDSLIESLNKKARSQKVEGSVVDEKKGVEVEQVEVEVSKETEVLEVEENKEEDKEEVKEEIPVQEQEASVEEVKEESVKEQEKVDEVEEEDVKESETLKDRPEEEEVVIKEEDNVEEDAETLEQSEGLEVDVDVENKESTPDEDTGEPVQEKEERQEQQAEAEKEIIGDLGEQSEGQNGHTLTDELYEKYRAEAFPKIEKEDEKDYYTTDSNEASNQFKGHVAYRGPHGEAKGKTYGESIHPNYDYQQPNRTYTNQIADYAMNILKFFEKIQPLRRELKNYTWWQIDFDKRNAYRGFLPFYSYVVNMYYPYPIMKKVTTCNKLIEKYSHYIFGIVEENNAVKYYVYGVPGRFRKEEQPYKGMTGFTTWYPKAGRNRERLGYWLLHIDAASGQIVRPLKPTDPPR